jgi:AcrR family transcriptional regulator
MSQPIAEPKKTKILDAARKLVVKRGFQDIAMDEVAKEAGVAKGTLFLHYKNKDELFAAVYGQMVDDLGAQFDGLLASGKTGVPLLEDAIRATLGAFDRNRDFISNFGIGRLPACGARSCGKLMERFAENHARLSRILAAALPGRRAAGVSYETAALFGLCRSAMMEKIMTKADAALAERTQLVLSFYLHGIGGAR